MPGKILFRRLLLLSVAATGALAQVDPSAFVNFEGAQTNPIRISTDGTRLFALNTPDARLSVFDLTQPSNPILLKEIFVGIEPVSVSGNPANSDEVWVVNQVSDSVSVVSISRGIVTDTIYAKDEPMDVVFANQLAFVSISRSNKVNVYNASTHLLVKSIPLFGGNPRAMAVSPDGTTVYVAFAVSGNHSTIIPAQNAPPQQGNCQGCPPPPIVGLIVDASDSRIAYAMPDNDVAVLDTSLLTVRQYDSHLGTINLGIAVQPSTGDIFVANSDARNLIHFESGVRGHIYNNQVTHVATNGVVSTINLDQGIDYATLPDPSSIAIALAQPAGIVFAPDGKSMYVAAYGTDRVAQVGVDGTIQARIEIGPSAGSQVAPATKRGPRGLAILPRANRLYVLNRIWNSISIVDTGANTVLSEIPTGLFDPTPIVIRSGRGFLFDAKLSGNGTVACAGCHVDAEMDHLAWDLGDPNGQMTTVTNQQGQVLSLHPMKGPMTTQTLRGLSGLQPYHWRGDRADFSAFNPAFASLMGGTPLSDSDMAAYTSYINTITFQPNPNENLDRTQPATFQGGRPAIGQTFFHTQLYSASNKCNDCHTADPGPGTNLNVVVIVNAVQPMKVPYLREVYQKTLFNKQAGGQSIDGFGLLNDGQQDSVFSFLSNIIIFSKLVGRTQTKKDLAAFVLTFDNGTAPAVGYSVTLTAANLTQSSAKQSWQLLQSQATAGNIDLIAKGTIGGQIHGLLFQPASSTYQTDHTGLGPFSSAQLGSFIQAGDTVTLMGVPLGSGLRMGIERTLNGVLDGD